MKVREAERLQYEGGTVWKIKLICCIILFRLFDFIASKTLNYFAFQSCDFERHLKKVIQEMHVLTKFDIYVSSFA